MPKINIEYVKPDALKVPSWKATYLLRPELLIVSASLIEFGFMSPIHVRLETNEIIDGTERVLLATAIPEILEHSDGLIPVVFHDIGLTEAMLLHLRLNRGHSVLSASKVSKIIRAVRRSGVYMGEYIRSILSMGPEEMSLLMDGDLIKVRKIKEHNYSKAWVPIEAPPKSDGAAGPHIEKPPNPDR